ncbi:MAG: TolC family protein [Planctomycetota bacterium]
MQIPRPCPVSRPAPSRPTSTAAALVGLSVAALVPLAGCAPHLPPEDEDALRTRLMDAYRRPLGATADASTIRVQPSEDEVEARLTEERLQELDEMSGPSAYPETAGDLGAALTGEAPAQDEAGATQPADERPISLESAIRLAVTENLDVSVAALTPAIADAQLDQAEAAFEAVFFTDFEFADLDTPQPAGPVPGLSGDTVSRTTSLEVGVRKPLVTGGSVEVSSTITRSDNEPTVFGVEEFYDADLAFTFSQPLLRNFGSEVNRAQIVLADNARGQALADYRATLLDAALDAETAYWNLYASRKRLAILEAQLTRTIELRDILEQRLDFDARISAFTDANAQVQQVRADLILARQQVRQDSDTLKQIIRHPDIPLASEIVLRPSDEPIEAPVTFSLYDALGMALQKRPELASALLEIDSATVRRRVADNARLPLLDLTLALGLNGVDTDDAAGAYGPIGEADFVDTVVGLSFEQPIGNRAAQAGFDEARLERQQAVASYRAAAESVVLEVKNALRSVVTAYELITATRASRRAAAENLRALNVEQDAGFALDPEFIERKLSALAGLADAESSEIDAQAAYMTQLATLYDAMGAQLERNRIVLPDHLPQSPR